MNQLREDDQKVSLGHGIADYFRTRLELFTIECEEAGSQLKGRLVPLVIIVLSAISAYGLFTFAIVALLGRALQNLTGNSWLGWEVAALMVGTLHLIILFRMKKKATSPLERPLFEYSRAELKRDRTWIQENNPTKKS